MRKRARGVDFGEICQKGSHSLSQSSFTLFASSLNLRRCVQLRRYKGGEDEHIGLQWGKDTPGIARYSVSHVDSFYLKNG